MRSIRSFLFVISAALVVALLGGGVVGKVGAAESSYGHVVTFSEVLSLVLDNYVDPVEPQRLLEGAYEGMLAGLDPNGAYLTPAEVAEWKGGASGGAGAGLSVLKGGRALQVVAVDPHSSAAEANIKIGDHIRAVDGRSVRDLSLTQAWRLLRGEPGSSVRLDLVHPTSGFARESVTLTRAERDDAAHRLEVRRGVAVLRLLDLQRIDPAVLGAELDDARSRGVDTLLVDLRNLADLRPRDGARVAALFSAGGALRLRDRAGRLVETLEPAASPAPVWPGTISLLVNGATAGSAEAFAGLLQATGHVRVLGEPTYGLGAEVKLFELADGAGLLVSAALWETADGRRWNGEGVQPDDEVSGQGEDYEQIAADQLERALDLIQQRTAVETEEAA
jgi:carboxyl-terminal processing protease